MFENVEQEIERNPLVLKVSGARGVARGRAT